VGEWVCPNKVGAAEAWAFIKPVGEAEGAFEDKADDD